ncbi:MAG: tetratricopeptide repeat protein [Ignavibacteria bacterium]|nr:tetratricopeptide repeat protein [Ignavibacteria bacterium]
MKTHISDDLYNQLQAQIREAGAIITTNREKAEQIATSILEQLSESDCSDERTITLLTQANNQIAYSRFSVSDYPAALEAAQKAYDGAEKIGDKGVQSRTLTIIAHIFRNLGDFSESINAAQRALSIAEEEQDFLQSYRQNNSIQEVRTHKEYDNIRERSHALNALGNVYRDLNEYQKSYEYYRKALAGYEEMQDAMSSSNAYMNLGVIYQVLLEYNTSLEYFHKALAEAETANYLLGKCKILMNMGAVYSDLKNYDSALENYRHALAISREVGNRAATGAILLAIGKLYLQRNDFQEAKRYFLESLEENSTIGNKLYLLDTKFSLGELFTKLGEYSHAVDYFEPLLQDYASIGNTFEESRTKRAIGELYSLKEWDRYNPDKAIHLLTSSLTSFHEIENIKEVYKTHKALAELYQGTEEWEDAFFHMKSYYDLERDIETEKAQKRIADLEAHRQISMLEKEREVERIKNNELALAFAEVKMLNDELAVQNRSLELLNSEKNEFLGIAAHDMKNPLASIVLTVSTIEKFTEHLSKDEITQKLGGIRKTTERMLTIISNLLDINAIESGKLKVVIEHVDIHDVIDTVCENYTPAAAAKGITLIMDSNPGIYAIADTNLLTGVLENLLSNAVKYSPKDKRVWIRTQEHEDGVQIHIQDEGPGMTDDDLSKLFGKFTRLSAKPTGGEHSTGLGLSIVKKLVEAMNGNVWCESQVGHGALFIVELPIAANNEI